MLSVSIATTSISQIAPQQLAITNASSAASELLASIDKRSLLDPLAKEGKQPSSVAGQIEIRNLTFAYPSRPSAPVLRGLDISLPAGKTTALVGPSGCGKSTLIGLLERWYQPTGGEITLDNCPIEDLNVKWLRSTVRLVQQVGLRDKLHCEIRPLMAAIGACSLQGHHFRERRKRLHWRAATSNDRNTETAS